LLEVRSVRVAIGTFSVLLASSAAVSCVPLGGADLPDTDPAGGKPEALLRLLVPQAARRPGVTFPVDIQVTVSDSTASQVCLSLWADPGLVRFPFRVACDEDGGTGNPESAGRNADEIFGARRASTCVHLHSDGSNQVGEVIAAYLPKAKEARISVFGALYPTGQCTGKTMVETAIVLVLNEGDARAVSDGGSGGRTDGGNSESEDGGELPVPGRIQDASGDEDASAGEGGVE
jgi:hypothetical protein